MATRIRKYVERKRKPPVVVGAEYERLTVRCVLGKCGLNGKETLYLCDCKCGNVAAVTGMALRNGTRSCGCIQREIASKMAGERNRGLMNSPEWRTLNSMKDRCFNKNNKDYDNYGGKGITIDQLWLGDGGFERFLAHVGNKPTTQHSIDRYPNQNGNYEPGNVRWATAKQQARNRKSNHIIGYLGQHFTVAEWAEKFGLSNDLLIGRLNAGWPMERALNEPVNGKRLNLL